MSNTSEDKTIKSAETVFNILECISERDRAGVSEIAKRLDYSKSTIHYYLKTLEHRGYLVKNDDRYRLGLKLVTLGANARQQHDPFDIVELKTNELASETGAVAHTVIENEGKCIYIAKSSSDHHVDTYVGMDSEMHCTAYGKAILAYTPTESMNSIVGQGELTRRTEYTVTHREELEEELERVRDIGLAYSEEEFALRMSSIAAPIFHGDTGEVYGAIGISDVPDQIVNPHKHIKARRFSGEVHEFVERTARIIGEKIAHQ